MKQMQHNLCIFSVLLISLYVAALEDVYHCFGGMFLLVSSLFLWSPETTDSCSVSQGRGITKSSNN